MDDAAELSRRIDDLLSGAIDEQVREQRAMAELVRALRDGIARIGDQVGGLADSVEAAREAAERAQLAPAAGPAAAMADRFESIETAIGELSATVAALADRPEPATLDPEEARALFGSAREATASEASGVREVLDGHVERLREEMLSEFSALRESLLTELVTGREAALIEIAGAREAAVGEIGAARGGLSDAIEGTRGGLSDAIEGARGGLIETVDAARAALTGSLESVRAAMDEALTGFRSSSDARHAELQQTLAESRRHAGELDERLRKLEGAVDAVAKAPEELRVALAELGSTVVEQTDTLLDEARVTNQASSERMSYAAERLTEDSSHVAGGLAEIAERFETLQESLLAYLQVRDIALEEERDLVIGELLDEFAQGLDAKQRQVFARGIRGAWAVRRERRAVRRLRLGGEQAVPRMPQVPPEALRAAGEALARPVPAERRPAPVPAAAPPPPPAVRPSPQRPSGGPVRPAAGPTRPAGASPRPAQPVRSARGGPVPVTPAVPGRPARSRPVTQREETSETLEGGKPAARAPGKPTAKAPPRPKKTAQMPRTRSAPKRPATTESEIQSAHEEGPRAVGDSPTPDPDLTTAQEIGIALGSAGPAEPAAPDEFAAAARSELSEIASALEHGGGDEADLLRIRDEEGVGGEPGAATETPPRAPRQRAVAEEPVPAQPERPSFRSPETPAPVFRPPQAYLPGKTPPEDDEDRAAKLARAARRRARAMDQSARRRGQPGGPDEPSRDDDGGEPTPPVGES